MQGMVVMLEHGDLFKEIAEYEFRYDPDILW